MRRLLVWILLFTTFVQSITAVETAKHPELAILDDSFSPQPSHADPEELQSFFLSRNISARLISGAELSDPDFLDSTRFDIVVLPYGACFPFDARDPLIRYLKQGGSFIALGGFAFDDLMKQKDGQWEKYETNDPKEFLSGRRGKPGDWIRFQPDQIVLFDPTYPFKRTVSIGKSERSPLDSEVWTREISIDGFPATAMTGSNNPVFPDAYARLNPLVTARDRYARPRGAVFSLAVHHDGPFQGSAWAFSGVTNVNLFSKRYPEMLVTLAQTVQAIRSRQIKPFDNDYLPSGLSLQDTPKTEFTFSGNYFHVNGNPTILFGANQTGVVWYSPRENPATWEHDLQRMRDNGLRVLRVLHFSPFAAQGHAGRAAHSSLDLAKRPPQKTIEQTDDLVALCAKHGVALFLTLHDWLPVELTDEELDAQETWANFWAARYKNQPHVFFDIQNEPSIRPANRPHVKRLWNEYLKSIHQTDENLKEAWGRYRPKESLGDIPCEPGPNEWENPRAADFNRFRSKLCERWIDANVKGIKSGNPNALTTVGFLQSEWQADKFSPTAALDFFSTHYHGPVERFPLSFKLTDRRFRGQGLSVGEFGAWDAHEARTHGRFADETRASIQHFLAVGHETLGMGGSMALSWDLKDLDDCVFPWGLTHAQDTVPKDWLNAYRNMSLFFSAFRPQYESPSVYLLIPGSHRFGANTHQVYAALHNALKMLFACHINFGVIDEDALSELPDSAKVLLWPVPYCPDDKAFDSVHDFVKRGGCLYFSGDIAFDASRRPTRKQRYQRLGLSDQEPRKPFSLKSLTDRPALKTSRTGQGTVHYDSIPVEMDNEKALAWNPYPELLDAAGVNTIPLEPNDPSLHLFSIPETNGRRIYTLFRNEKGDAKTYRFQTVSEAVTLDIDGMETALAEIDRRGDLTAIEGSGDIRYGNSRIARTSAHVMIRSVEGEPIPKSKQLWIFPTRPGELEMSIPAIKNPILVAGEFVGGKWKTYEETPLQVKDATVRFTIDPDRTNAILLLAERGYTKTLFERLRNE